MTSWGGGAGLGHQRRLGVRFAVDPDAGRTGDAVRTLVVVQVDVSRFGGEVKLVVARAAHDVDADRQLALASDRHPIVTRVQVEANLPRLLAAEQPAEVGLRASRGLNRDLHSLGRPGHRGYVAEVGSVDVGFLCKQLIHL